MPRECISPRKGVRIGPQSVLLEDDKREILSFVARHSLDVLEEFSWLFSQMRGALCLRLPIEKTMLGEIIHEPIATDDGRVP